MSRSRSASAVVSPESYASRPQNPPIDIAEGMDVLEMGMSETSSLDQLRVYVKRSKVDIFDFIKQAIVVAATDRPDDFSRQRVRIVEKLFSFSKFSHESEEQPTQIHFESHEEGFIKIGQNLVKTAQGQRAGTEKDNPLIQKVSQIKKSLLNNQEQSEELLLDSLLLLQSMQLSVDMLRITEIGKVVSNLKGHESKKIRRIARSLICSWKDLVGQWFSATAAVNSATTAESVVVSTTDVDKVFPFSPPNEVGKNLSPNPYASYKESDVHDNPRCYSTTPIVNPNLACSTDSAPRNPSRYLDANFADPKEPLVKRPKVVIIRSLRNFEETNIKQENPQSDLSRLENLPSEDKQMIHSRLLSCRSRNSTIQEKPTWNFDDDEAAMQAKLEISKRKLHESYQKANNAKKQRIIRVLELQNLPKQPTVWSRPIIQLNRRR